MSHTANDIGLQAPIDKPIFDARLVPHRSLSRQAFMVLMALFAATCVSTGIFYFTMGAWPVLVFLLVDVLIFYIAIQASFRAGRRSEEVSLTRQHLTVRKLEPNGRQRQHTFNTAWAKFIVERDEAIGIIKMQIVGEGYVSTIGGFLNPDDKESFAHAFASALATAKR
ncbi:MAG: DUF2244 domain-containing protein [Ahrensia sp.]